MWMSCPGTVDRQSVSWSPQPQCASPVWISSRLRIKRGECKQNLADSISPHQVSKILRAGSGVVSRSPHTHSAILLFLEHSGTASHLHDSQVDSTQSPVLDLDRPHPLAAV